MATNRASLSDTYAAGAPDDRSRVSRAGDDTARRSGMVVGGAILALLSLALGSIALIQVWVAPASADGVAATTPALQSWEAVAMIIGGGIGFAAGLALVGIGMGRWGSPRPPSSDADYTGPGVDRNDMPEPPRVV